MVSASEMNQHIASVMETMDWPDDAFIPIANDENRGLMESIEQQIEAKKMKINHRDQLNGRVKLLNDHHLNTESGVIANLVKVLQIYELESMIKFSYFKI